MIGRPLGLPGSTIGLLGGSFDPPHEGHVHITKQAIKAFNLSKIWWLVSPSNPLKDRKPEKLSKRYEASRKIMQQLNSKQIDANGLKDANGLSQNWGSPSEPVYVGTRGLCP